jgi:hypothetical protein
MKYRHEKENFKDGHTISESRDSKDISGVGPVGCAHKLLSRTSRGVSRINRWSFHLVVTFGRLVSCLVDGELPKGVAFRRHSGKLVEVDSRESDMETSQHFHSQVEN